MNKNDVKDYHEYHTYDIDWYEIWRQGKYHYKRYFDYFGNPKTKRISKDEYDRLKKECYENE